ncbi:pentapeptide repeat-containing protein [Phormidesmis sp. 146-33]
MKSDEKFALIRTIAITLGAIGGTSFCGADLTDADFTQAILKSTNFNHTRQKRTVLHQVCWSGATKLDRARLGTSILANSDVRKLLTTRNGYKKSYANADLSNANLKGANLNHANLTQALAVGADFSQACLTGACLESWNIDHTTKLDQVDCQYVFLLEQPNAIGSRERRPHDPDKVFQPGDFEKLYAKIMTTMQLLLRNGVNPEAFAVAFQKLMQENPDISPDSVQAIEKKGNDVLVTLQISEGTDKGKLEHTFDTAYQAKLEAQKNAELLESEKRHNQELNHLALTLAQNTNLGNLLSNLTIVTGNDNTMTDNKNQGINTGANSFVNTGTNQMINSILNMSGAVTNALNQLPNTTTEEPGIKELLTRLQTAIESDPELSEKGKTNALEQVKTLAEVGQNPEQPEKKNLGEKAMIFLKGTIATLSDTAKLAEAAKVLLPLIAKALGLPV